GPIPPQARASLARAVDRARQGELDGALAELDELIKAYPATAEIRRLACQLRLEKEGPSDAAAAACTRVGELDPNDASGEVLLARAWVEAGKLARAHEVLGRVLDRTASMTARQDEAWSAILGTYQAMNAITWAEQAMARAPA